LLQRASTGRGAYVEVSLEEAALTGLINQASNWLMAGHAAKPIGTLHPNIAPYGERFTCADGGRIILAVGSDAQFRALCTVLALNELPSDARFARNVDRVRNRVELAALLGPAIAAHARTPLLNALIDAEVPAGAVNTIDEALASPTAQAMVQDAVIDGQPTRRIRGNAFRIEAY
jgi:crotonobetainyl-CoA:carnitine CoA-transferase CaiB-like acyl-CoA transferase